MDGEAADLLLEVDELHGAVLVIGCSLLLRMHAALLEESSCGIDVMAADGDVSLLAWAILLHDLDKIGSENGAVADSWDEAHQGLEFICD
ncbi:MAG TPA: hypothetical protein DD632_03640, partial [Oribacterium sp.]|nr:hypothetical protein [Oribacterium sp.]